MNNRILITGAHGFCAGYLAPRLVAEGLGDIYVTDIHAEPPIGYGFAGYIPLDITDNPKVNEVVRQVKPDLIFHLAGVVGGEIADIYRVNFLSTVNLLEAIRRWSPHAKILLAGSAAEYGLVGKGDMPIRETQTCNPTTPYGISKYAATLAAGNYAFEHGMKIIVARPFNIVGGGVPPSLVVGAVLERISEALLSGCDPCVIPVGDIDAERDFIAVEDVVEAYLAMIDSNCYGEIFNVCSGRSVSIREVLNLLVSKSQRKIIFRKDNALLRTSDSVCICGSGEKAFRKLGFSPKTALEDSLQKAWRAVIRDRF